MRSASVLEYLRGRYDVTVASFQLPHHSKSFAARAWRNTRRFARGVPPLVDRFAGFEPQLAPVLEGRHYRVAVAEHFWVAPYAKVLRPHCDVLVMDLHNVESPIVCPPPNVLERPGGWGQACYLVGNTDSGLVLDTCGRSV